MGAERWCRSFIDSVLFNLLRETDSIFVTEERNILLNLPFTAESGISVVIERIRQLFSSTEMDHMNIQSTKMATIIYPEEATDEKDILKILAERLPHGELLGRDIQ